LVDRDALIDAMVRDADRAILVSDFDGVLSPIVSDPETSRMLDGVAQILERIARRLRLVAVISGRPLAFLIERASIPGVRLIGSYGVEEFAGGERRVHAGVGEWVDRVESARTFLRRHFADHPGIVVEDKAVSVAVHWRRSPDRVAAERAVQEVVAELAASTGLRRESGKLVEELRPPLDVDKGTAIADLVDDPRPAVVAYAGDDVGDLPAFRVVLAAGGFALLVDHGEETDPRLRAMATVSFDGAEGFAEWLRDLAARLEG
jgi:trehalose 6-phosphate phosphatase